MKGPLRGQVEGIHVLRAIAATMVVTHHAMWRVQATGWPDFGPAGVDIFFVISGFVMELTARPKDGHSGHPSSFLGKRLLRIVPLYWVALLWAARRQFDNPAIIRDFLFIPRINPGTPGLVRPVVNQGWTLNIEMVFYLIFALAMLFGRARLLVIAVCLVLLSSLTALGFTGPAATLYSSSIVFEFGLGIALFHIADRGLPNWSRVTWMTLLAIGFLLLAVGWERGPRLLTSGLPALLIVLSSLRACRGWLKFRAVVLMGNASYAIYLFHWTAFGAARPLARLCGNGVLSLLIYVATGVLAGIIVHLTIEKLIGRVARSLPPRPAGRPARLALAHAAR